MKLTKIKRRDLKRGDIYSDENVKANASLVYVAFADGVTCSLNIANETVYRIDASNDTAELTTRLEECRHAKQVLQEFIDTLNIKITKCGNECEDNATHLELLDAMFEIVNPIIQSGEYSHPAQSSGFLSRQMSELCHRVTAFRRQHNIVGGACQDIDDEAKEIVAKYSGRGAPEAMPRIPKGLPAIPDKQRGDRDE